jgi:hypothetical protein
MKSTDKEITMSLDMEGHNQTSSDLNLKSTNGHTTMDGANMTLEEKKKRLKKSIAMMMVYWVAHSRHDLRPELIDGNPDGAWAGLALKEAFDTDQEWRVFFDRASKLFNDENVKKGAERISSRVHGHDGLKDGHGNLLPPDWDSELDELCPGNPTLDVMYEAAAKFVDSNDWNQ